jgi:hypothetical protein
MDKLAGRTFLYILPSLFYVVYTRLNNMPRTVILTKYQEQ